jgi:hypothetical protein
MGGNSEGDTAEIQPVPALFQEAEKDCPFVRRKSRPKRGNEKINLAGLEAGGHLIHSKKFRFKGRKRVLNQTPVDTKPIHSREVLFMKDKNPRPAGGRKQCGCCGNRQRTNHARKSETG